MSEHDLPEILDRDVEEMRSEAVRVFAETKESVVGKVWITVFLRFLHKKGYKVVKKEKKDG